MHDVVIQGISSNVFWLLIVLTVIAVFHRELRNLLSSLGSFKIAGASFELKDQQSTLQGYVLLTNIMVEMLTQNRDTAIKLGELLSEVSVRQLAQFAVKYAKEVPDDVKQVELLKNIGAIITRRGDSDSARLFYDALLKSRPRDLDVLHLKALALYNSGDPADLPDAEKIQDELVRRRFRSGQNRFNRALTKVALNKPDEAIADLESAIDLGFWRQRKDLLMSPEFAKLRELETFKTLQEKLKAVKQSESV